MECYMLGGGGGVLGKVIVKSLRVLASDYILGGEDLSLDWMLQHQAKSAPPPPRNFLNPRVSKMDF